MDMKVFKNILVKISVCLLLTAFSSGAALAANALPQQARAAFDQKVVARVNAERAIAHVRVLSEEIGTRLTGLTNEYLAGEYIAGVFEDLGYDVEFHDFALTGGSANVNVGYITFPDDTLWETGAAAGGLSASGPVFDAGSGLADDYPEGLEPGFIALVRRGQTFASIAANAKAAGAAGVIVYNTTFGGRGNYPSAWSPSVSTDIPFLGAAWIHGMRLLAMLEAGGEVYVDLDTMRFTNRTSRNVIATKPASNGDPNAPIVAVTAHYDSVVGSPGANDNASGVATVLELARVFKSYNTDMEIRFIAFGAEEVGLVGSNRYVQRLTAEERARFVGVFNADMVATNHPNVTHLVAATPNGVQHIVTDSAAAAGARLGDSSLLPTTFGSSDHVPFHNAGIPAALFIWLGGNLIPSSYEIELFYHTPQDTILENMSAERFKSALTIIGAAVFDITRKQVPALFKSAIRTVDLDSAAESEALLPEVEELQ